MRAVRKRPPRDLAAEAVEDPSAWREAVHAGDASLSAAAEAALHCRACELWKPATQTVFGRGRRRARVMLIGEQPGDQEDCAGEPFVGPAGHLLDRALEEAGIDRAQTYVTNVVKHFHFEERGKWRIHKKPRPHQIRACRPWLDLELDAVRPKVVVLLGATAAQAILGSGFRVTRQRGELLDSDIAEQVMATVHPSSILRAPDAKSREEELRRFVADLRKVRRA